MRYLRTNKGLVVVSDDGDAIPIEHGNSITLCDEDGNTLFAWECDGKISHTKPMVEHISTDGLVTLSWVDYVLQVTFDDEHVETGIPIVKSVIGELYSGNRTFIINPSIRIMITPERRKIDEG